jgi:hypothetical protein
MGVQINLRVHEGAGKLLNAVRRAAFRQLVSEVLGLVIRYFHSSRGLIFEAVGCC